MHGRAGRSRIRLGGAETPHPMATEWAEGTDVQGTAPDLLALEDDPIYRDLKSLGFGQILGRYILLRRLAAGGIDRTVMLPPPTPAMTMPFAPFFTAASIKSVLMFACA